MIFLGLIWAISDLRSYKINLLTVVFMGLPLLNVTLRSMDSPAAEWGLLTGFFLGFYDWAITKRWAFGDFLMMTVYGGALGPVAVLTIYLASWGVMRTRMYISNKGQPARTSSRSSFCCSRCGTRYSTGRARIHAESKRWRTKSSGTCSRCCDFFPFLGHGYTLAKFYSRSIPKARSNISLWPPKASNILSEYADEATWRNSRRFSCISSVIGTWRGMGS